MSWTSDAATFWIRGWDDDPSMGVREPRKPKPPELQGGAAAPLNFEPEPEAEGVALSARVNAE